MAIFDHHHPLLLTFGVLGNIVSIFVYFAPLPTFLRIYKTKSTLGFQSLPYVIALFSAMLWMYYAFLKVDAVLLISVNAIGCVIETIYIVIYLVYASKEAKRHTGKLVAVLNIVLFSVIFFGTLFLFKGSNRVRVVGWISVAVSVSVFAAPLSIVFRVVQTKSVEFMPFSLSFFLTLSAIMWFIYGLLHKDLCVALPNVLGFFLGMLQMMLYGMYRNAEKVVVVVEKKLPDEHILKLVVVGNSEVYPVDSPTSSGGGVSDDEAGEDEKNRDNHQTGDHNNHEKGVGNSAPDDETRSSQVIAPPVLIVCAA